MKTPMLFVNRRKGYDRREDRDPCRNLPIDLYHRKRRKAKERRDTNRTLAEDYSAFFQAALTGCEALGMA